MRKLTLLFTLLILSTILSAQTMLQKTLKNGMDVIVKENKSNESVTLYCFVKTGSIHEGEYLGMGLSHYLEHVVSSGTSAFRTEAEYEQLGKEMGAVVNAYTTYDKTAYHIATDRNNFDLALQMIAEQVNTCQVNPTEVSREKEVILKEIVMRSTPPMAQVYQRNNELVFRNSPMGQPIIGYVDTFKEVTRDQLADYYEKRYVPNNMVFAVSGNIDAKESLAKIEKVFSQFEREFLEPVEVTPETPFQYENVVVEEFQIQFPFTIMTSIIPSSDYDDAFSLDIALNYLFGKRYSPIKYKLTEELKLVNYVYGYARAANNQPQGTVTIGFEAKDPKDVEKIKEIIDEELNKICKDGFPQKAIDDYVNRQKASQILSAPSSMDEANQLGVKMIEFGTPDLAKIQAKYEMLTPLDLKNAVSKHLLPKNRVAFTAVPFGQKELLTNSLKEEITLSEPKKIEKKDLDMIYRFSNRKELVRVAIGFPGISDQYHTIENSGKFNAFEDLMFSGSKNYKPMMLTEWFEDHLVNVKTNFSSDGFTVNFSCIKDDLPEMQKILVDAFTKPSYKENELNRYKSLYSAYVKRSISNAEEVHNEFRSSFLYKDQIAGLTKAQSFEQIQSLTSAELKEMHKKYFTSKDMIISVVGDISEENAMEFAKAIRKAVPNKNLKADRVALTIPSIDKVYENKYDFDQVNIDLNLKAPSRNNEDYDTFRVIQTILSGSRGRLHRAVRGGTNDLAYFAYSYYAGQADDGFLRLTSQTSPSKKDELISVLKNELEKLKNELVTEEEINGAIDENIKMMKAMITDKSYHNIYTNYEMYGLGYDYFETTKETLKNVTPERIKNAANKYFNSISTFVSIPKNTSSTLVE